MRLFYLYHSGFLVEFQQSYVLFDFFLDGRSPISQPQPQACLPRLPDGSPLPVFVDDRLPTALPAATAEAGVLQQLLQSLDKPLYILVSHFHCDHFQAFILKLKDLYPDRVHLVFSRDIYRFRKNKIRDHLEQIHFLKKQERLVFPEITIEAFGSTDVGVSFVVSDGSSSVFHAGDYNDWHWEHQENETSVANMRRRYEQILETIVERYPAVNACCFPCDPYLGADFSRGLRDFAKKVRIELLATMHMWELPEKVSDELKGQEYFTQNYAFVEGPLANGAVITKPTIWVPYATGSYVVLH